MKSRFGFKSAVLLAMFLITLFVWVKNSNTPTTSEPPGTSSSTVVPGATDRPASNPVDAGRITSNSAVVGEKKEASNPDSTGTPLPAIHNSSDTHCDYSRQFTDGQFADLMGALQRQWNLTPEWLRGKCLPNSTYPSMEDCILKQTMLWGNAHPDATAPWINPDNYLNKSTE